MPDMNKNVFFNKFYSISKMNTKLKNKMKFLIKHCKIYFSKKYFRALKVYFQLDIKLSKIN